MTASRTKATRPYEMRKRAQNVEATRERILQATYDLILECTYDDLTLQRVADQADTTFQTVLRHFGSKDDLIGAVAAWASPREFARRQARPSDVDDVVRVLCARYEETAGSILRWEALEDRIEVIGAAMREVRRGHRAWLANVFRAELESLGASERNEKLALLYAATDINTWRLWRHHLGLSAERTRRAMRRLLAAALAA
ncbi:MAG: TetR/AcrR family transcriptional regulator [Microthrixaceae bacterium]